MSRCSKAIEIIKSLLETQVWLMQVAKTDRLERSFASKLRAHFSRMQKDVVAAYKKTGSLVYDKERYRNELMRIYYEECLKCVRLGANRSKDEIQNLHKKATDIDRIADSYIKLFGLPMISGISSTTEKRLRKVIRDGIRGGLPVQEIADKIREEIDKFKSTRSITIARTEVARATNYAYWESMRAVGFTKKKYITALDEHVCPICGSLNGKIVEIGGDFSTEVNGVKFTAKFPPIHPNCRCTLVAVKEKREKPKVKKEDVHIDKELVERVNNAIEDWQTDDYYWNDANIEPFDKVIYDTLFGEDEIEKILDNAEKYLGELAKEAKIYRMTHANTLLRVLRDGRFKNQFETGTSSGLLTNDRMNFEDFVFGTYHDVKKRPIYGFWLPGEITDLKHIPDVFHDILNSLSQYGGVVVKFKDGVKKKATMTFEDTLGNIPRIGVPFNEKVHKARALSPDIAAEAANQFFGGDAWDLLSAIKRGKDKPIDIFKKIMDFNRNQYGVAYTEAQIHGGVSVDEIEKVIILGRALQDEYEKKEVEKLIEELKKRGIKYEIRDDL